MAVEINLTVSVSGSKQYFEKVQRQIPFALSKTINVLLRDIKSEYEDVLPTLFDRPRPFTVRGHYRTNSTKQVLKGEFGLKSDQAEYLSPQIEGGSRKEKEIEKRARLGKKFAPSRKAPLDAYGNLPKTVSKALQEATKELNSSGKSRRFFSGKPLGPKNLPDGVYARVNDNTSIVPLSIFIDDPTYERRLSVSAIGDKVVLALGQARLEQSLSEALASAR